jgi:hypothetical protein
LIFHTRFVGRGEQHEVRVHQLYFNDQGWPVAAPHRFAGESAAGFTAAQIPGRFKLINHGKDIAATVHESVLVTLAPDGAVTGEVTGSWTLAGERFLNLVLGGVTYRGVVSRQWDDDKRVWVQAFSALSSGGVAVWGSKVATANVGPSWPVLADRSITLGETLRLTLAASDPDVAQTLTYSLVNPPVGASIGSGTGELTWTPQAVQAGVSHLFTVWVADNAASPAVATASFRVAVVTPLEAWRAAQFGAAAGGPEAADLADPDADGLVNLLEYSLGSAPRDGGVAARPVVAVAEEAGGTRRLRLGFTRIADPALTYTVEAADALDGVWAMIWTSSGTANAAGAVTVEDSVAVGDGETRRFLRLRVTR